MKIIPKTMAFLLLSISLGGHAQAFSERTDEIVRTVIFVDGFIDKDMHREFWEAVEKRDKREAEQLIKWVHSNILMIQEYQRELWESALISYGNGKVVKTERLIKLEAELPAVLKQSLPFSPGSPEYTRNEAAINIRLDTAMENSRNLLNSASRHTEFRGANGEVVALDEATIVHVIENIGGSIYRVRKLLSREWKE